MTILELIQLFQNKMTTLSQARSSAFSSGDVVAVMKLDEELLQCQIVLDKLTQVAS